MNPVALQLASGGPIAPTSWGAFGPSWMWSAVEGDTPDPPDPPDPPGPTGRVIRSPRYGVTRVARR